MATKEARIPRKGKCERCGSGAQTERHHPLPKRHFGGHEGKEHENPWTVELCHECHKDADRLTAMLSKIIMEENKHRFVTLHQDFMASVAVKILS
jgi:hypothetical protein